jgi:hypothetical protein
VNICVCMKFSDGVVQGAYEAVFVISGVCGELGVCVRNTLLEEP